MRGERQAAEKLQGPRGLNEAGIATGHARARQRAHDHLADYQQKIMDEAKHQRDRRTTGTSIPDVRGAIGVPTDDGSRAETQNPSDVDAQMDESEQDATNDMDMGHVGSLEPEFGDFVSEMLLASLASSGRRYGREMRSAHRRIVSEIYSPPRVTAEIKRGRHPHLVPGFAFDLTVNDPDDCQPWDFSAKGKREKARTKLNTQKPYLFIGSP